MKIVLLESLGCSQNLLQKNMEKLQSLGHELKICDKTDSLETLKNNVKDANALMLANMPLPAEAAQAAKNLEFVDVAFTGVDHLPMRELKQRHIPVSNASGYANDSVAELCISFMIQLLRDLPEADARTRQGKNKNGLRANLLKGKTVGIIGAGSIGLCLARLCKAFGARIIVHNRHKLEDAAVDANLSLEELLATADIVSLHCPLTESTRHLLGKKEFEKMKRSAFVINTARGGVIDNEALFEALQKGIIAGAAIDVFDQEPPLPKDYPLLNAKNIILTPHIGYYTEEAMEERARIAFDNLYNWLDGKPSNLVNA